LLNDAGDDVAPGETSYIAARRGVYSTTASRALLQIPAYLIPPALLTVGPIKRYLVKNPGMALPVTTYILFCCCGIGLPACIAVFPSFAEIRAEHVEDKFQHLVNAETGKGYATFRYNKGL
jgi:hypothetical protein